MSSPPPDLIVNDSNAQDQSEEYIDDTRFLLPQGVGVATEDIEKYRLGGFHPVHLGDKFNDGRYRIVNKLGSGGFSTVWLARDDVDRKWVALKIVAANHSEMVQEKNLVTRRATETLRTADDTLDVAIPEDCEFTFEGPNGKHLCMVLSVLGPSASDLSHAAYCRLRPWLARKVAHKAAKALAGIHSRGLCHGDLTTGNILFGLKDFDRLGESEVMTLLGAPVTGELETESGEPTGPEAPRYIVKDVDFLSLGENIITDDVKLVDFDQCFLTTAPPDEMLGTPIDFLAPEVAVGMPPGPASDVWALGCCFFRLRSGLDIFESPFEVIAPIDLIDYVQQTLGEVPGSWRNTLWDANGQPTVDPSRGKPLEGAAQTKRPLEELVRQIWDEPDGRVVQTGTTNNHDDDNDDEGDGFDDDYGDRTPFNAIFSDMVWKPTAVKVDDEWVEPFSLTSRVREALPKIPEPEADLLLDLLSKIFTYEPEKRITAAGLLDHPWFHMSETSRQEDPNGDGPEKADLPDEGSYSRKKRKTCS